MLDFLPDAKHADFITIYSYVVEIPEFVTGGPQTPRFGDSSEVRRFVNQGAIKRQKLNQRVSDRG